MAKYSKRDQIKLAAGMYPNGTLKNKLGIHDAQKLSHIEFMYSAKEMGMILHKRPHVIDIDQLRGIHYILFHRVYTWAGKVRDFDISKNGHNFLPHAERFIAERYINSLLRTVNNKPKPTANDYAKLLDNINDMHPFREGNGRSTKCFLECVAMQHQQFLQFDKDETDAIIGLNKPDIPRIAKHIHVEAKL